MHNLTMHSCTYHNPSQDDFIPKHARTTIPHQATKHKFRLSTRHRAEHVFYSRVPVSYRYCCIHRTAVQLDLQLQVFQR